jgi:hypothetical protein
MRDALLAGPVLARSHTILVVSLGVFVPGRIARPARTTRKELS